MNAGIWVCYYPDFSDLALFHSEVEALRYALKHHMEVVHAAVGVSLKDLTSGKIQLAEEPKGPVYRRGATEKEPTKKEA